MHKPKVLISGYYGFNNIGDELILQQIINYIKSINPNTLITVLSNNPQITQKTYSVESIYRFDIWAILNSMLNSDLLISGGGGLFQDVTSVNSPIYYFSIILLAKMLRLKVCFLAQGIGPLKTFLGKYLTVLSLKFSDAITVRDIKSHKFVISQSIKCYLTQDPVWNLKDYSSDISICNIDEIKRQYPNHQLIALSLRPSKNLNNQILQELLISLKLNLNKNSLLVLVPMQLEQDLPLLKEFKNIINNEIKCEILEFKTNQFSPSTFLNIFKNFDFVIAMRLHALIISIKCGINVMGLAYDPKVNKILDELNLPKCEFPNYKNIATLQKIMAQALAQNNSARILKELEQIEINALLNKKILETLF